MTPDSCGRLEYGSTASTNIDRLFLGISINFRAGYISSIVSALCCKPFDTLDRTNVRLHNWEALHRPEADKGLVLSFVGADGRSASWAPNEPCRDSFTSTSS